MPCGRARTSAAAGLSRAAGLSAGVEVQDSKVPGDDGAHQQRAGHAERPDQQRRACSRRHDTLLKAWHACKLLAACTRRCCLVCIMAYKPTCILLSLEHGHGLHTGACGCCCSSV